LILRKLSLRKKLYLKFMFSVLPSLSWYGTIRRSRDIWWLYILQCGILIHYWVYFLLLFCPIKNWWLFQMLLVVLSFISLWCLDSYNDASLDITLRRKLLVSDNHGCLKGGSFLSPFILFVSLGGRKKFSFSGDVLVVFFFLCHRMNVSRFSCSTPVMISFCSFSSQRPPKIDLFCSSRTHLFNSRDTFFRLQ
jgi:hypothetical protein